MEDVEERGGQWTRDDYRVAARSLGRLSGRLPERMVPRDLPAKRRDLRGYFFGRVTHGSMPLLRDDASWAHPLVRRSVDAGLRDDLEMLATYIPDLLDRLDALPRTFAHGDACPQNLLRPAGASGVVAIDWTFAGIYPVGTDAGQLLAGRAESGELAPGELPELLDEIAEAYIHGLRDEDADVSETDTRLGIVGNLVVRSAFTALPLELLASGRAGLEELFASRARYARFLVDLADEVVCKT